MTDQTWKKVFITADVYDKEKRSSIMKCVRPKENKSTEIKLMSIFKKNNIKGWRRNYKVKGHPDFIFLDKRIAIFVDGCFWHGHDCRNTRPSDNADYWVQKRGKNMLHDKEIIKLFKNRGWTVLRIWECELKRKNIPQTTERILTAIKNANEIK